MSLNFKDSLRKLERLSPEKLDETSRRIRGDLASAEWKMGLCLLALKRSGAFRKLGFGTLTGYAERVLNLSGRKVGALLSAAEALGHLPLMSEAYRNGAICWSKVRVMHGLATPETEAEWLEFAKAHTSVEVERKVAVSPRDWKRHRAMEASLAGKPVVDREEVSELLSRVEKPELRDSAETDVSSLTGAFGHTVDDTQGGAGVSKVALSCTSESLTSRRESPVGEQATSAAGSSVEERIAPDPTTSSAPPLSPQTIRLVFELTPDQYALYEQAESRVRAQEGRRIPRADVLKKMADLVLSQGTARARARHQVLVHKAEGSDQAWYETDRGILPVAPEVLKEAMQSGHEVLAMEASGQVNVLENDSASGGEVAGVEDDKVDVKAIEVDEEVLARGVSRDFSDDGNRPLDRCSDEGCSSVRTHICETATSPQPDCRGPRAKAEEPSGSGKTRTKRKAIPNPNDPDCLELLCRACHTKKHETDFETKPHWREARAATGLAVTSPEALLPPGGG